MGHQKDKDAEQQRLAEAADRIEITELLHRYAHAIDNANFDLLAEVFTPDATLDFGSVDQYVEGESVVKGLGAIRAWFEKALAPFPGRPPFHDEPSHRARRRRGPQRNPDAGSPHEHGWDLPGPCRPHEGGLALRSLQPRRAELRRGGRRLQAHMQAVESGGALAGAPGDEHRGEIRIASGPARTTDAAGPRRPRRSSIRSSRPPGETTAAVCR